MRFLCFNILDDVESPKVRICFSTKVLETAANTRRCILATVAAAHTSEESNTAYHCDIAVSITRAI